MNLQEGFKRLTFLISAIAFAVSILLVRPYDLQSGAVSFLVPWAIFGIITYTHRSIKKYCGRHKKTVLAVLWTLCIPASIGVWHFHPELTNFSLSVQAWHDLLWVLPFLALCGIGIVWGSLTVGCIVIGGTLVWVIQGFSSNHRASKSQNNVEFRSPLRRQDFSAQLNNKVRQVT